MLEPDKIKILLHYDSSYREELKSLSKFETLILSMLLILQASLTILFEDLDEDSFVILIILSFLISFVCIFLLIMVAKKVKGLNEIIETIKDSLLLYENGIYREGSLLSPRAKNKGWKNISMPTIIGFSLAFIFLILFSLIYFSLEYF